MTRRLRGLRLPTLRVRRSIPAGPAVDTARAPRRRRGFAISRRIEIAVSLLIVINITVLGGLLIVVVLDRLNDQARDVAAGVVVPPSATPGTMQMGLAHIPTSAACTLCHDGGGKGGLKTVPAILHPIEGWRRCTVCHTDTDLGRTAPGHQGIVEDECLNCHKTAPAGPAITQPHAALHDQHCLDCHGGVAHLPSSMATSREEDCVLCHKPATLAPPSYPHAATVPLSCRSCHQSPEVGGLPIDHALRSDATCLLCHDIKRTGTTPAPASGSTD